MQKYIGTKVIKALPMTRLEYNGYRGWELPEDEQHLAQEAGMLVEYADTSHQNVDGHEGYVSWSPLSVFETSYRQTDAMSFGLAIDALKEGYKVARSGWNGKEMFLYYVPGSKFKVNRAPLLGIFPEGTVVNYGDHIDIKKADGTFGTWSPSNSDALAEDWVIV